ncbi:MAG TPA: aldo/keto reductase [Candidatus Dormibacteraeota bacterium]|nr:aldo/keto reductase [Candidatus Dormibacteraeota bacterium]
MTKITASAAGTITLGDLTVNRMGYGAMRLTGRGIWGEPRDPEGARRVLRRAVELDVNFIDTADSYGPEVSERLIREALWPYPADLVIATKGGLLRDGPDLWRPDRRPSHLRQALEGSLKRLGLERIDLYQFHRPDPAVPYEESIGELVRLKNEGKIRHIGVSNVNEAQLGHALALTEIVSVQNRYNLSDRASEGVLEQCESLGKAFLPWYALAASQLTRAGNRLEQVASEHGATPGQLALAWLLARSPVMLPIPGTSSVEHLEENIAAVAIRLSPHDVELFAAA